MALLQLLSEEDIAEDRIHEYFEDLYRIVCVSERPAARKDEPSVVRSTYLVDWEQLVHLLEDYTLFGEDIVEVTAVSGEQEKILRPTIGAPMKLARA